MIKTEKSVTKVKDKIFGLKDKDVSVTVNLGRNRKAVYNGRLGEIYSDIFTVVPAKAVNYKTTFSYAEIICGNVVIKETKIPIK